MPSKKFIFVPLILALSMLLVGPPVALAQEPDQPREEITDEQVDLNEEAVEAIFNEDYVRAISLLRESLLIGELNVTYLNLGRAYQKAGKCEEAQEAYQKALTAPAVQKPPRKLIAAQTEKYVAELDEMCGGEEGPPASGSDTETAEASDASTDDGVSDPVESDKVESDKVESDKVESDKVESDKVESDPAETNSGGNILGWTATIAGVALVGGGVGMHFLAEAERSDLRELQANEAGVVTDTTQSEFEDREQTANTYDTIGLSAGIIGGLTAATGIYLLVTSDLGDQSAAANLWVGDGGGGVTWTTHF